MPDVTNGSMAGIHIVDEVLVVQTPGTFDDESLRELRSHVLDRAFALGARGVILDVSALRVLDSVSYDLLADTARTLGMLGAKTLFSGFQPGVVAALIELDVDSGGIEAVRDISHGLNLLRPGPKPGEDESDTLDDLEDREGLEPEEDGDETDARDNGDETEPGDPGPEQVHDSIDDLDDEADASDDEDE